MFVLSAALLRLVQAATDAPSAPNLKTKVIRVEPDGSCAATNTVLLVRAEGVFEAFDGEPKHMLVDKRIPKGATGGTWTGTYLDLDTGEIPAQLVTLPSYPDYRAVIAKIGAAPLAPRSDYGVDAKALYDLASSHPDWPKTHHIQLVHRSAHSAVVDLGLPGVTALIALARLKS